ncbi:MAG: hypothetical protein JSS49_26875 [Planctomycetes bacterium]|nr:hypothetical protein [Planctomycetota bacterium]
MKPAAVEVAPNSATLAEATPSGQEPADIDLAGYESGLAKSNSADSQSSADPIERLKAALHEDVERARTAPRLSSGAHEVRVRVESMLEKSRRLFDLGQLREARHTAKIAHDLGDSARLDYLPDEERPIDLVQRIDDQMREVEQAKEAALSTATATQRPEPVPPAAPKTVVGSASKDSQSTKPPEADAVARQKRDWSYGLNVFRRDRKPGGTEPNTVPSTQPSAVSLPVQMGIEAEPSSASLENSDGAVVQANRSLTLNRDPEQSDERVERQPRDLSSPIAYVAYPRGGRREEPEDELQPHVATEPEVEQQAPDFEARFEERSLDATSIPPARIEEDATPPPAEFDEVKPIAPARDRSGQSVPEAAPPLASETRRPTSGGWLYGIAGFAVCAVFAGIWYRRGAT